MDKTVLQIRWTIDPTLKVRFYNLAAEYRRQTGDNIDLAELGRFLIETALDNFSDEELIEAKKVL